MGQAPSLGPEMAAGGDTGRIQLCIAEPLLLLASRNNPQTGQADYITVLCACVNPDLR